MCEVVYKRQGLQNVWVLLLMLERPFQRYDARDNGSNRPRKSLLNDVRAEDVKCDYLMRHGIRTR